MPEEHAPLQGIKNCPCQSLLPLPPSYSFVFVLFIFSLPTLHLSFLDPALSTTPLPFFPLPLPFGTAL